MRLQHHQLLSLQTGLPTKLSKRNAEQRLQQKRFALRQDLQCREHELQRVSDLVKDSNIMKARLRSSYEERLVHFQHGLDVLQKAHQREEAEAASQRSKLVLDREIWIAERQSMLEDMAHLESHTAEVRNAIEILEQSYTEDEHRLIRDS